MKILNIILSNYRSFYGEHSFKLTDRGLCLVMGDNQDEPRMNSNGAGKSTIFDALDWCLFGKEPRGDYIDSIINEEAQRDCQAIVNLEDDDGTAIMIKRYRHGGSKPPGLTLIVGGKDLSSLDTDETQKAVERVLGLDREVFHVAVLMGQLDLLRFADAKESEQMPILTKILQLGQIDEWLESVKEIRKTGLAELGENERKLGEIAAIISGWETQLPLLDSQSKQWQEERAQKLREATQALNQHLHNIEEQKKIAAMEARVEASFQQAMTEQRDVVLDLSQFDQKIGLVCDRERTHTSEKARLKYEGTDVRQRLDKFQKLGEGDCPECGQKISGEHLAQQIAQLSQKREEMLKSYAEAETAEAAVIAERRQWEDQKETHRKLHWEADKENFKIMEEIRNQKKGVEEAKAFVAKAQEYVEYLRSEMAKAQAKPDPFFEQKTQIEEHITSSRQKHAAFQTGVTAEKEAQRYYEFWVEGFGPKGLKSYILDNRLQEMTDAANHWVRVLTGGTIWIRFESQTKGRTSKTLSNKLNVRVFRYNPDGTVSERNYRSWSGGEKQRVSLGIDFGLSRLIANRARKQYDLLILDELFRHLDRGGREAVIEMLAHLRQEKNSVIVIDHDETFQGAFENRVMIPKKNRRSTIQELDYATEQGGAAQGIGLRATAAIQGEAQQKSAERGGAGESTTSLS